MENKKDTKDDQPPEKRPKLWGLFYLILGVIGLIISGYSVLYSLEIVPLIGSVTIGILIGALSIFIIAYGYRIMKKDL
jgi:hypothetical protein